MFFDLETTGISTTKDRIVELSYIKVFPDGSEQSETLRVNPGMPIPAASTAVHHITDADVAGEPTFAQLAQKLYDTFDDSDMAGFNSNKFDVPMLIEEFARAGFNFQIYGRRFVDVQNIFHKMEPRTLVGAYRFYCGKDLEGAHSALADTKATYEVLLGQLEKYDSLSPDVESLAEFSKAGKNVDLAGRILLDDNDEAVFNFGKHKGRKVKEVFRTEPSFYNWMMQADFTKNTKDVITRLYRESRQG